MQIFRTMQEAESTDITRHPSYAQLSNEQRKEVNEVYRTAFLNNQGRVGYKIAEGIAYATAKELTEKYVGFKALAAKVGPGAAAAIGDKKYGKKAMEHAAKTGTSLKGHKKLGESEDHGCPDCGSSNISHHSFDYGHDSDTGYHDAGGRYRCADCGSEGDADDVKPMGKPMLDASHREMAKHKNFDEAENAPGEGDGEYPPGPYCGESENAPGEGEYPPGPYCGESEDDPEKDAGSSDVQKKNLSAKKGTGKEPKDVDPNSVHPPVPEKSDRKGAEDKAAADVKSHDDEAIQGAAAMLSKHGDDFMNKASEARADIKSKETAKFKDNWADKKDDAKKDDKKSSSPYDSSDDHLEPYCDHIQQEEFDVIAAAAKYIGYRQECAGKGAVMSESVDEGLLDRFKKKDMNRPGIHDYLKGRGFRQEGGSTKHLYGDHSGEGAAPEWQASYHHPKHKNTWVKLPAGNKGFELHHNNEIHKGHDADDLKRHMTLKVGNLS